MSDETNWAGNHRYDARAIVRPATADELHDVIVGGTRLRALGSRHSFNDLADTTGDLVSLERMPELVDIDADARTVTVAAGMRYGDVATRLQEAGWALDNLASLPHISVAGAVATGTHGSGDRNGTLAAAVTGIELMNGSGELVSLRRGDADFDGAIVNLGALGIATTLTLDIRPTFDVSQRVYLDLPWEQALENFDLITDSAYSVSTFTDWRGDTIPQVWLKSAVGSHAATTDAPLDDFFGARPATEPKHMLPGISPVNCTEQLGVAGPWQERLPHFRLAFTPSNGEEIQSEFLMDRRHAVAAMQAVRAIGESLAPVLQISEIRTMKADALWLSGAFGADTVAFHFTWLRDTAGVEAVLPALESALAPFAARPHWGKVFLDQENVVPSLYPRMADFRSLAERYDPRGVFVNAFLSRYIYI